MLQDFESIPKRPKCLLGVCPFVDQVETEGCHEHAAFFSRKPFVIRWAHEGNKKLYYSAQRRGPVAISD